MDGEQQADQITQGGGLFFLLKAKFRSGEFASIRVTDLMNLSVRE